MRGRPAIALLVFLLATPPAWAGTADRPEVSDPAGDQAVEAGPLIVAGLNDDPFDDVDVVAAWVGPESGGNVAITIETTAALTPATALAVSFKVEKGPTSLHTSTASGAAFRVDVAALQASGVAGVAGSQDGTRYAILVPLASIGATGGDLLSGLAATASRADAGDLPIAQDDQAGADTAPDTGGGAPYTFFRVPVRAGLALEPQGGTVTVGGHTTAFAGAEAPVGDGDADVRFTVEVRNTGTDVDTATLGAAAPAGVAPTVTPRTLTLEPGASGTVEVGLHVKDGGEGTVGLTLSASSARGATAALPIAVRVNVPAPPAPEAPREPTPAGLDFLTPWAEALGLDDALGTYAELFLLALLVVAAILLVFLLLALTRRPWVKVRVEPRTATVAPGGTAEFRLAVDNPQRGERHAKAHIVGGDGPWRAGAALRQGTQPLPPLGGDGDDIEIVLAGRRDRASHAEGTLRVQVPPTAAPHERHDVEVDVVPLGADGGERRSHAGRARVRVEAAPAPSPSPADRAPVRLDPVSHNPDRPAPGDTVESTVTLHNDGDRARRLRVVLSVDGAVEAEARVELPPRSDETVRLEWEAGAGPNQVRVQAFAA